MVYNLIITDRANELVDFLTAYLLIRLKNPSAASHFLSELDAIYDRLKENPYQFSESKDRLLRMLGYRDAQFREMDYHVVFRVDEQTVYVVGVFHNLEDYARKVY